MNLASSPSNELGKPWQSPSRKVFLLALLLAATGVGLLYLYIRRFEQEASGGQLVQVLTAISPIRRGTVIRDDMLGVREIPITYVEPRAVRAAELQKVRGIAAGADLDPQDTLLWSDLALSVEERDLSSLVQPGNRALTIIAGRAAHNSQALIRPGDYVDVLGTFHNLGGEQGQTSVVLLQRVLVLAVGEETERKALEVKGKQRGYGRSSASLTLSLKIEEAQLLSLARQDGELSVVLRSVDDPAIIDGIPNLNARNLVNTAARINQRRISLSTPSSPTKITSH